VAQDVQKVRLDASVPFDRQIESLKIKIVEVFVIIVFPLPHALLKMHRDDIMIKLTAPLLLIDLLVHLNSIAREKLDRKGLVGFEVASVLLSGFGVLGCLLQKERHRCAVL
jgi:hypothetical protein